MRHEEAVKVLLGGERMDVDIRDDGYKTLLLLAIYRGHKAVVQLLL